MVPTLRTDLDCLDLAATGTVGASPLRAVIEHPHMTSAGVYVHGQDKVGGAAKLSIPHKWEQITPDWMRAVTTGRIGAPDCS